MIDDVTDLALAHAARATFSPEEALVVLNALPMYRAPSVLAAVLSRGFLEHKPSLAVKHGHGLALLPHYPTHVLFDDLWKTAAAAGTRGDLPTIKLLWRLAGPTTPGRSVWLNDGGFLEAAVRHGKLPVLRWLLQAARATNIKIDWSLYPWFHAAAAGHTETAHWAIAQGLIKGIRGQTAFLSTRHGDFSVAEWWITTQHSKDVAMKTMSDKHLLARVSNEGLIKTLDWWWASSGSKLPEPDSLTRIANAALCSRALVVVEWWWARFLEHHTPEHTFGSLLEISQFNCPKILDWHWQKFHEKPDYFACPSKRHKYPHGVIFSIDKWTTLPIVQWAVNKITEIGGQKLVVKNGFIYSCVCHGDVGALDLVLQSVEVLDVDWSRAIVACAVQYGHLSLLEWWDLHRDKLPPQDLDCSFKLPDAAMLDAVDVLEWWHTWYRAPTYIWQRVCIKSIEHNSHRVQLWLADHMAMFMPKSDDDKEQFMTNCTSSLKDAKPFTLTFFSTIFPDLDPAVFWSPLPMSAYHCTTSLYWFCALANVTVTSLLPLKPRTFDSLFQMGDTNILEWWLQAHLAAGHLLHFPSTDELEVLYTKDPNVHMWVDDMMFVRKISVLTKLDSGMVLYKKEYGKGLYFV
ncbi:hypothetical protein BC828DRAFT_277491 [Blastocladiella britannica]|nr:hypothetical protein BC828DRAFT_277491 [Blastocladiella britannica]